VKLARNTGFVLLACVVPAVGTTQPQPRSYWAVRADGIVGGGTTEHLGAGMEIPLDAYTREGIYVAGGATERDGSIVPSGRLDLVTRFLLDPYRQVRWAWSLGGGLTVPFNESRKPTRPNVAVIVDLEGPRTGHVSPAVEVGVGGGARLSVVLRANGRAEQR
jgi:hypothetical protein